MIDKRVAGLREALAGVGDGSTVMVGGFGSVGQPNALVEAMVEHGARDLTVIANNSGSGQVGVARLLGTGRVRKLICSYPRSAGSVVFEEVYRTGSLELELVPQGTLAERIRAAGAGIPAFYTPAGYGTQLGEKKESREIGGRHYLLEYALAADVALIEAWQADRWGNLTYRSSARNFNPIMAMASTLTIVQASHIVELGALDPEAVATPGIFVDRVVHVPDLLPVM